MPDFKVVSEYEPAGDQPQAIQTLKLIMKLGFDIQKK